MNNTLTITAPIKDAARIWSSLASTAGAVVPEILRGNIARRVSDLDEGGESVTMYDILEACADACREAYQENPSNMPTPRGFDVSLQTHGGLTIIWASDRHTITMTYVPCYSFMTSTGWRLSPYEGLKTDRVDVTITGPADSDRMALAATLGCITA